MECKWYQVCPMKRFYEKGRLDKIWVDDYCNNKRKKCIRYKMEEKGEYHPNYMLPDGSIRKDLKNGEKNE